VRVARDVGPLPSRLREVLMFDLADYELFSDVLLMYACGFEGRNENDPVYQRVTEGRDVGAMQRKYSSCADLAHWLHFRLGLRTSWINRAEHKGWKSGVNVSKLAFSAVAKTWKKDVQDLHRGDVGVIWSLPDSTDAHVFVFHKPAGEVNSVPVWLTAEYGQPGGAPKSRTVTYQGKVGSKTLHKVIPLSVAIETGKSSGLLVKPDKATILEACAYCESALSGEILDRIENLLAPI
jgi:hypothetical protein